MGARIWVVDAFTDRAFAGNPAGVVLLETPAGEDWMRSVAAEMRHSETAFISPRPGGYDLRWYTPTVEIDLCGHATLASAHVLWEAGIESGQVQFETRSGTLTVEPRGSGAALDFPAKPMREAPLSEDIAGALGTAPLWNGSNGMDWLALLPDQSVVTGLAPDMATIERMPVRGLIVTAQCEDGSVDFVSRFFAPQAGVPEDPVTGSAHCALGPFWAERLGKSELTGFQASPRGGRVGVEVHGDRVTLLGQARTVLAGTLAV